MSRVERVARSAPSLEPPPGLSPLRLRLLRLCLTLDGAACPDKLDALRRMSLREALQLEAAAHHRQRESLRLQDALEEDARGEPRDKRRGRRG